MNLSFEKYLEMSAEELLLDDYFIESARNPTVESKEYWHTFQSTYPEKSALINEASVLISNLEIPHILPPSGTEDRIWNNIVYKRKQETLPENPHVVSMGGARRSWVKLAAAAIFTGIVASGVWWWNGQKDASQAGDGHVKVSTGFGEQKQVILPDSSIVSLNSNSSISYNAKWDDNSPREVWIEGEGFFEVIRTTNGVSPQKKSDIFEVHAGNLMIQVLGTRFNVNNRDQKSVVMLMSGKVRVQKFSDSDDALYLEPGDIVSLGKEYGKMIKTTGPAEQMDAWQRGLLFFDNTPLRDVISIIEQQYGLKVNIENASILNRTISGQTPAQNIDILLKSISVMMKLDISSENGIITIR